MPAITGSEFEDLMQPLGPFEDKPHMAVAVSGGADSLALTLLAHAWARQRGGTVTALTVDHGLRPAAAGEARQVGAWLGSHGITHEILPWRGQKPHSGIQAAARAARYDLLAQWCRRQGVLHLLVAHHGDDQAETVLLRADKNSGPAGLSAMAPVRALAGVRLLRPLLRTRHDDLVATLAAIEQPWLEDPSNQDARFARIRARRRLAENPDERDRLLATADGAAVQRREDGRRLANLAARCVRLHPAGYCWFDPGPCLDRDPDLLLPLLGDVLCCIGGNTYRPRRDPTERLCQAIISGRLAGGRTLGGVRILARKPGLLVCREAGRTEPAIMIGPDRKGRWDRFTWSLAAGIGEDISKVLSGGLSIGPLGQDGWQQIRRRVTINLPSPVRATLPALRQGRRILAVPHLNVMAKGDILDYGPEISLSVQFSPPKPLQPDGLLLV
jgi:tRNA(Ile)-lysidine synthase